jgi:hypothetical protein
MSDQTKDAKANAVLTVLRARGALSKEDVVQTWSFAEPEYAELKKFLLKLQDVESGPRKVGGFRIKARRSRLPDEAPQESSPIPCFGLLTLENYVNRHTQSSDKYGWPLLLSVPSCSFASGAGSRRTWLLTAEH